MIHKRARSSLLAAAVAAGVVAPAVWAVPGVAGAVAAPGTVGSTVTLLTGDKVTLGGANGVSVHAAKGRGHVSFYTTKDEQGDTHVIPEDALSLVSSGKLDPRLFDVTELVRDGYDDASRPALPLIVDYQGRTPRAAGARVSRELPVMGAAAVSAERSSAFWATARGAEHVWLDGPVRASLDHSVPQIGAPEAWAAGYTGAGTTVAVLDTGVDVTHPDLADAVVNAKNFTDSDTDDDRFGHGTHVASIITGSGAASGGRYKGVAPDAKLLNGKVLNDFGGGQESWIIAGMEWAAESGADVVNMSLGSSAPSDGTDPMSQAVNRITADTGTLFVIAAGNSGGWIGSPGRADAALTVGAVDGNDQLAEFSSRGTIDGALKPDITAPGVNIVAAKAKNGVIGEPAADGYVSLSGTSMATPHVAGAAAILAGEHPDWTAAQLKPALMGTAKPNDALSVYEQGAGRVDVAKAVDTTVFSTPASVDNGTVQWPHGDDQPVIRTVTYTNSGAEPVTLDLAATVRAPDGSAAPQGMFTLTPASLTIPAGGQAAATVTTDTKVDAADGEYSGVITATGGGQSVRTPIAVNREVESYDVTVEYLDQNGAPTDLYFHRFVDVHKPKAYLPFDPSGTVVARLPKGEYYFEATVQTEIAEFDYQNALFAEPAFVVSGDSTLVVDARRTKPVGFTVDKPNARAGVAQLNFLLDTEWGQTGSYYYLGSFDDFTVMPSATSKKDRFDFLAEARMAEWNGTSFTGQYLYHVRHTDNGSVPATLRWTVHDRQLAKVRGEYAAATPGMIGVRDGFLPVSLPSALTEYYTPNVPWTADLYEMADPQAWPPVSALSQMAPRTYRLGHPTTVRWNAGVFGPAFPDTDNWYSAARLGDEVNFDLPLTTDQGPGRGGLPIGDGATTLSRDGQVVGETPYAGSGLFTVAPEQARYTVRSSVTRPAARLSTSVSGEWTFSSGHVDGEEPAHLPLLAVRFSPDVDDHNAAPAGRRFTIPVSVERNHAALGNVHTPAVEVSYDDGATWQRAAVGRHHGEWQATVNHPRGANFVSLRASVSDRDGNSEKVTIIRAYALR
ncbi:S8 family serine peptidase [Actinophytocola sp.]|uniref:S8 family peptidase n=1 Tax=Actinophytocola sp. TaxID=1872138 RepID=UPI002D4172EC|nr:S8 family serine peptidase [Actinophytocola sp.]HYQ66921.1 S8 family serine peptidase [Actinophytocola sp.]